MHSPNRWLPSFDRRWGNGTRWVKAWANSFRSTSACLSGLSGSQLLQQSLLLANHGLDPIDSVFLSLGLGLRLLDRRSLGPSISFELAAHALQFVSHLPVGQVCVSRLKLPGFSSHLEQFDWVAKQQSPHIVRHLVWVVNRQVSAQIRKKLEVLLLHCLKEN